MHLVPRHVRELEKGLEPSQRRELSSLREHPAWVLLGEPGAGKSTVFEDEASRAGGVVVPVATFIHDPVQEQWRDKILFLDGLDETPAMTEHGHVLMRVKNRLIEMGRPKFRIACRAADWLGYSDEESIATASRDGKILKLALEPLSEDDIARILAGDSHVPGDFIDQARERGVFGMLRNPQTLHLFITAVRDGKLPSSRQEAYELACEQLVVESSKRHRASQWRQAQLARDVLPDAALLEAAGYLCAVLLMADKSGIALDREGGGHGFVALEHCAPPDLQAARSALGRSLFRPEGGEERVVPTHRSVAEYLAGRWLAKQVGRHALPLSRVMRLLAGADGRTVAGLRGLYAWLALHSVEARQRLIDADPLTVVVYGDVTPMSPEDKRRILARLRHEAERYAGFRRDIGGAGWWGALADARLRDDFISTLRAPERDESAQSYLSLTLDVLREGDPSPGVDDEALPIVRDDSFSSHVRSDALRLWLRADRPQRRDPRTVRALLDDVAEGRVVDRDDELLGELLKHLYPGALGAKELLRYIGPPKQTWWLGTYRFFLHELPQTAPAEHVPLLLDAWCERTDLQQSATDHGLREVADRLLARGIREYADSIPDERLFAWLGIDVDEDGHTSHEGEAHAALVEWFGGRLDRYRSLVSIAFSKCEGQTHPAYCVYVHRARLRVAPPEDLGGWHLEQVDVTTDDALARLHLRCAVESAVACLAADKPGLSLEALEAWAAREPTRGAWLAPMLAWDVPDWRSKRASIQEEREKKREAARCQRAQGLRKHLPAIEEGSAPAALMHQLAGVWMSRYADIAGSTPAERFANYATNGAELYAKAEVGFRRCPERADLPAVQDIIDLALARREHFIRLPCLVGMELRWRDGAEQVERLSEDILRRMIAFRLTDGSSERVDWFTHLLRFRSGMVAEVLVDYAGAALKAKAEHIAGIHELARDADYRAIAASVTPRLLEAFPVRAKVGQLGYLADLLRIALRDARDELAGIFPRKLSLKGMDAPQRVYWLATAALLERQRYESSLWQHLGRSEARWSHLARFLGGRVGALCDEWRLPPQFIGKLIEGLTPHAQLARPNETHWVSPPMERGDQVRALIRRLAEEPTDEAVHEIGRLLSVPALGGLKPWLEAARHEIAQLKRESEFRFLSPKKVGQILLNEAPVNQADLAALVLDHLEDIARELRHENDDGYRAFWNLQGKERSPRAENDCRDALLRRLRAALRGRDLDCQPERDHAGDRRVDLCISYRAKLELPIEIKRDTNSGLWSSLRAQLIDQYTRALKAQGHGIYLVLWFGRGGLPRAPDGGKAPRDPLELQQRLEAQLTPDEKQRVFVRVIDVAWPSGV